jgi:hypothetical protein
LLSGEDVIHDRGSVTYSLSSISRPRRPICTEK